MIKQSAGKRILACTVAAITLLAGGCSDFLDVPPVNAPIVETTYARDADLAYGVNAAYSSLQNRNFYARRYLLQTSLINDDERTSEGGFANVYSFIFTNEFTEKIWLSIYQSIYRANIVIKEAPKVEIRNQLTYDALVGESHFIRAVNYWHLARYWELAPIIEEPIMGAFPVTKAANAELWAYTESQCDIAASLLPEDPIEKGRVWKYAAYALKGKALLQQKKYQEAADNLFKVINTDDRFALLPDINDVWTVNGENGKESIFEIQFQDLGLSPWGDDSPNDAGGTLRNKFYGPTQEGGYDNIQPSLDLMAEFEPGDLRVKAWIWQQDDPLITDGLIYDSLSNKWPYNIRKGNTSNVGDLEPGGFSENTPVIRYADVLLMMAECLINGASVAGAQTAEQYIDMIRARAFGTGFKPVATLMTEKGWDLMTALKHERRCEMCFELQRFDDLVRWGDAETRLAGRYKPDRRYWPIPVVDIDRSKGTLTQNPGY